MLQVWFEKGDGNPHNSRKCWPRNEDPQMNAVQSTTQLIPVPGVKRSSTIWGYYRLRPQQTAVQGCFWSQKRPKGLRTVWAADLLIIKKKKPGGGPSRAGQSTSGQQTVSDSFNGRTCFSEPCCPYFNDTLLTTDCSSEMNRNQTEAKAKFSFCETEIIKRNHQWCFFLKLMLCLHQARIKRNVSYVAPPL